MNQKEILLKALANLEREEQEAAQKYLEEQNKKMEMAEAQSLLNKLHKSNKLSPNFTPEQQAISDANIARKKAEEEANNALAVNPLSVHLLVRYGVITAAPLSDQEKKINVLEPYNFLLSDQKEVLVKNLQIMGRLLERAQAEAGYSKEQIEKIWSNK